MSVHIIVKLQYMSFGDLYAGAIVISRGKNKYPVIYTEDNGNIIGGNHKVRK